MWRSIRSYQTVAAKIVIRRRTGWAVISAIGPEKFSLLIFLGKALVNPVPDESALKRRIFFNHVPVILKIAGAVAHGMSIFAQDQRPGRIGFCIFFEMLNPGIHRAIYIGVPFELGPFIVNGAAGITLF